MSAACAACSLAWVTGSPGPSPSAAAMLSARAPIASAIPDRTPALSAVGIPGHGPVSSAFRAASTAGLMSAPRPTSTCAYSFPVAGSVTPYVFLSVLCTCLPPMKWLTVSGTTMPPGLACWPGRRAHSRRGTGVLPVPRRRQSAGLYPRPLRAEGEGEYVHGGAAIGAVDVGQDDEFGRLGRVERDGGGVDVHVEGLGAPGAVAVGHGRHRCVPVARTAGPVVE